MTGAQRLAADLAVSAQARSIAREHLQWALRNGDTPRSVGRAVGHDTPTWADAWAALAMAWEEWCGPHRDAR